VCLPWEAKQNATHENKKDHEQQHPYQEGSPPYSHTSQAGDSKHRDEQGQYKTVGRIATKYALKNSV
jgi:hypothetical protein